MTAEYRITERENVCIGTTPYTVFALFERRPHPIQNHAYEFVGKYRVAGHNASEESCLREALCVLHGHDDE